MRIFLSSNSRQKSIFHKMSHCSLNLNWLIVFPWAGLEGITHPHISFEDGVWCKSVINYRCRMYAYCHVCNISHSHITVQIHKLLQHRPSLSACQHVFTSMQSNFLKQGSPASLWQFFIVLLVILLAELILVILFFVYSDKVSYFCFPCCVWMLKLVSIILSLFHLTQELFF